MKNLKFYLMAIALMLASLCSPVRAESTPTISGLDPSSATPGGPAFTLVVYGTDFDGGSTVSWGSAVLVTTFVNATELSAVVPASLISNAGTAEVTVAGGGGTSAATIFTIAPGWFDDFGSYVLGSFPSSNWTPSGNNGTTIVDLPYYLSAQSAQLYGEVGNCWAALIYREIPVSPPFTIQYYANNGNESLSGCHPNRADVQLGTGPAWQDSSRDLAYFDKNGDFDTYINSNSTPTVGPAFPLSTWVKVRITYETPNASAVDIGYWLNDQFYKSSTVSPQSYESQLTWLALVSQEGTSWFDDVSVTAGLPITPSLSVASAHKGNFTQGQSGATYSVTVGNAQESAPSVGLVTVTDTLTSGLTLVSMAGTGWSCTGDTCTRSDQLGVGESYPPITVTVDVLSDATVTAYNQVSLSGGGSMPTSASDTTTINSPAPTLTPSNAILGAGSFTVTVNGAEFVSGSSVHWNGTALPTTFGSATQLTAMANCTVAGTVSVNVVNPGASGRTSDVQTFTCDNPFPSITALSQSSAVYGESGINLTVTGSGFVDDSLVEWNGVALGTTYVSGTQLTAEVPGADFTAPGTILVTVFNPSPGGGQSNTESFTINKANQTITFTPPTSPVTFGVAPIALSASGGGSGNAVTFSIVSGPGSVNGNALTITGVGTVVVAANQVGNTDYNAATQVTHSVAVNQAIQKITFSPPTSPVNFGVPPLTLVAAGGASENPVTFTLVSGPGSLSGPNESLLTLTGVGTIVIAANQAGNADYAAAAQVTGSITVQQPAPATLTSPLAGSTLTGPTLTLTWTAGTGVTQYDLHVGTTGTGSSNIFAGAVIGQGKNLSGIPTTGGMLNVRLYSLINGAWQYIDYAFTEASPAAPATMSSPTPGTTLTSSSAAFTWTAGSQVTQYDLHVGTTGVGSSNIFGGVVSGQSTTVTGIPTAGGTFYVRLYSLINGAWQYIDYTYTEFTVPAPATMMSPTPSSTLTGSTVTFSWTAGTQVKQYDLHVGTTGAGSSNVFGGVVSGQSTIVTGIPTTGGTLYVRLYSLIAGAWQYVDYTYTEQ